MSAEADFDLDAGVADIADSMGLGGNDDENELDLDNEQGQEQDQETEEVQEPEVVARKAPDSWSKEQHETWSKLPKEAQDYIELREKQMLDGIEQYKQGNQYADSVSKAFDPFRGIVEQLGLPDEQIVHNLLSHHAALTQGTLEQRQQALYQVGVATGIIQPDGQQMQAPPVNPIEQELKQRLERIEQMERKRELDKIESTIQEFASRPENEYFDELANDIAKFIDIGDDLKTAYDKAVWANPTTRAKEMAKQTAAANSGNIDKARKASSVNIKSSRTQNVTRPNQQLGSWDDTMKQRLDEINR